jgi:hypothetical protein
MAPPGGRFLQAQPNSNQQASQSVTQFMSHTGVSNQQMIAGGLLKQLVLTIPRLPLCQKKVPLHNTLPITIYIINNS